MAKRDWFRGNYGRPSLYFERNRNAFACTNRREGAVCRHCEFTTGSFVEPITVGTATRLAFDVASTSTMEEWTRHISPPHIEDSVLRSQRGEFLLKRISSNKTLLRGTTWYDFDMAPYWYWTLWSDAIIHKIHERVLTHIAQLSEEA